MQLAAVDGDVLLSRAWIAGDHQPGRDVRAAVVLVVGGERKQPLEIYAAMDDLLRRRRSRLAPGDRIPRGLLKASENLARLDPHGLGHPAAAGNQPGDAGARMSAGPRKQGGAQPIETLGDGCEPEAQANARLDPHHPLARREMIEPVPQRADRLRRVISVGTRGFEVPRRLERCANLGHTRLDASVY